MNLIDYVEPFAQAVTDQALATTADERTAAICRRVDAFLALVDFAIANGYRTPEAKPGIASCRPPALEAEQEGVA